LSVTVRGGKKSCRYLSETTTKMQHDNAAAAASQRNMLSCRGQNVPVAKKPSGTSIKRLAIQSARWSDPVAA
jgi:hypothetical protein